MARLIDADELADYITENEDDFLYALKHKDRHVLDSMIKRIPTTYDIDKVVEELEKDDSVKLMGSLNSNNYMIPLSKAIEIVKRDGK